MTMRKKKNAGCELKPEFLALKQTTAEIRRTNLQVQAVIET